MQLDSATSILTTFVGRARLRAESWSGLALWALTSLLPGIVGAVRQPAGSAYVGRALLVHFQSLFGIEALKFLPKCPMPLFLSLLPLAVMGPVVVLLLTFGTSETGRISLVLTGAAWWLFLNATCFALVGGTLVTHGADAQLVWSWAFSLCRTSFLSALPTLGLATLIAATTRARLVRLVTGVLAVAGVGFWGYVRVTVV